MGRARSRPHRASGARDGKGVPGGGGTVARVSSGHGPVRGVVWMRGLAKWAALAAVTSAACTTGHEPNGCDSDLQIAVDGGATVRFRWDSDCVNASPSAPYR